MFTFERVFAAVHSARHECNIEELILHLTEKGRLVLKEILNILVWVSIDVERESGWMDGQNFTMLE